MDKRLYRLYQGDYNFMTQEWQSDGTVIVSLYKHNDDKIHRLHIKNLYQENEELIKDEIVTAKVPNHILNRMREVIDNASTE